MSCKRASHTALPGALCAVAVGLSACVSLGPATPSTRYELQAVFEGQPVAGREPGRPAAQRRIARRPAAAPRRDDRGDGGARPPLAGARAEPRSAARRATAAAGTRRVM